MLLVLPSEHLDVSALWIRLCNRKPGASTEIRAQCCFVELYDQEEYKLYTLSWHVLWNLFIFRSAKLLPLHLTNPSSDRPCPLSSYRPGLWSGLRSHADNHLSIFWQETRPCPRPCHHRYCRPPSEITAIHTSSPCSLLSCMSCWKPWDAEVNICSVAEAE